MAKKKAIERAKRHRLEGKSPGTQAGEFVREVINDVRKGKHGARSAKQIIAIGLSKARRSGVPLKPPSKDRVSEKTWKSAQSAYKKGQSGEPISKKHSTARRKALKKESSSAASYSSLSRQAREVAKKRSSVERSNSAKKAARTRALNKKKRKG
jgi:hypothetical protein